jgi:hypothetical protein
MTGGVGVGDWLGVGGVELGVGDADEEGGGDGSADPEQADMVSSPSPMRAVGVRLMGGPSRDLLGR